MCKSLNHQQLSKLTKINKKDLKDNIIKNQQKFRLKGGSNDFWANNILEINTDMSKKLKSLISFKFYDLKNKFKND